MVFGSAAFFFDVERSMFTGHLPANLLCCLTFTRHSISIATNQIWTQSNLDSIYIVQQLYTVYFLSVERSGIETVNELP